MQSQRWQDRQISCGKLVQILFIIGAIIFLLMIGVIWTLSVIDLISAMWAAVLTVITVILALLLAFLQWYVPRSLSSPNPQVSIASSPERVATPLTDDQAYDTFIEREREKLSGRPNPHGTGMLVIRADKTLVNDSVVVGDKSAIISEHTEKGQRLYIGIIKDIKAGNASATTPHRNPRGFTIHAREVTEIDLRNGQ